MKSMTGYGRGEASRHGFKVVVEITSVNRKQTDINLGLPREIESLEPRIRDEINRSIARGRLNVRVALQSSADNGDSQLRLNRTLARRYAREYHRLAKELHLNSAVSLDLLARSPGVLQVDEPAHDPDWFWPALEKALQQALSRMIRMREKEGTHLSRDLQSRMTLMRRSAARIRKQAPNVLRRYQEQLRDRIRKAGLESPEPDDERLLKEVVLFADRSDITEELTRLESHFQQFQDCLKSPDPVGRMLDFLSQEMNREFNTIGSKANDSLISREVVILKTELERFREQVQNVE
jgi:uncharacterized protein (TIGR00255 family)